MVNLDLGMGGIVYMDMGMQMEIELEYHHLLQDRLQEETPTTTLIGLRILLLLLCSLLSGLVIYASSDDIKTLKKPTPTPTAP